MCLYTYHHYPACGHIANWTVTSCKEYTNSLRLLSGAGLSGGCCNHIQTTHDLLSSLESNTCSLCDLELSCAASHCIPDAFPSKNYRAIEGLDSKGPIIELSARMNVNTNDEEEESHLSTIPQECCDCACCSCFASPFNSDEETDSSGVSFDGKIPSPDAAAKVLQYLDAIDDSDDLPENGELFEFILRAPRCEEENTADIHKVLRQGSSKEDISPSCTQLGTWTSRNSLHGAIHIGINTAVHSLKRPNTRSPNAWSCFDPSDDEPELTFFDQADESSYSDDESEVRNPNAFTFLHDDSGADDGSDGRCELPNNFDDDYADMFSSLPSPLVPYKIKVSSPLVRDSAPVVDRPATPIPCPAPLRVIKPPQFLSLDSVLEEIFNKEGSNRDTHEVGYQKAYLKTMAGLSQNPFVTIKG